MFYPALRVHGVDVEFALAAVDECGATAASEHDDAVLIVFPDAARRSEARHALAQTFPGAQIESIDVDDEDWARRSQEDLQPVIVGSLTIVPDAASITRGRPDLTLVIPASMGFGTGHHASTRLCLIALQEIDLTGKRVLDLGTGSGVLAIAARALGAAGARGIDDDPDAVRAAREGLQLNPRIDRVHFDVTDLRALPPSKADVITANLTGALLARSAPVIASHLVPAGVLIASGLRAEERDMVVSAFHGLALLHEMEEDGWVGLVFRARW